MTRWERFFYGMLAAIFIVALAGCAALDDAARLARAAAKACHDGDCR